MSPCATCRADGRRPTRVWGGGLLRADGSVLLIVLAVFVLLGGLVGALMPLATGEPRAAAHARDARAWRAAAEGALEVACGALAEGGAWDGVLAGTERGPVFDTSALNFEALGAEIEQEWAARLDRGADTPRWVLYAAGPAAAWLGSVAPGLAEPILAVWVADDGGDGDAAPLADSNGRVLVHAEAVGPAGGRAAVTVLVERAGPSPLPVRRIAWWST